MPDSAVHTFVIGPIGDEHAPLDTPPRKSWEDALETYEKIIQPACAASGITAERADEITAPGEITVQIFTRLRDAPLVIADLTGANPNVMYELGLRHSLAKPVVQIGEYGTLPFDVRAIRTIPFTRTPRGFVDGRERLEKAIASVLSGDWEPVTATLVMTHQPFGDMGPPVREPPAGDATPDRTRPAAMPEGTARLGFLELLAEMESAFPELSATTTRMGELIKDVGQLAVRGTKEFEEVNARGGGARDRLLVTARFAERLGAPATELEQLATAYEDQMGRIDAGMDYILSRVEGDPNELSDLGTYPDTVHRLSETAIEAFRSSDGLIASMDRLGRATRAMDAQTSRVAAALRRVAASREVIGRWSERFRVAERRAAHVSASQAASATIPNAPAPGRRRRSRPRRRAE